MQETKNELEIIDTVIEDTVQADVKELKLSPAEQVYEDLKIKRMGKFTVGIAYGDAVFFRNLMEKSTFKGPQQAYLLLVAKSELVSIVQGLKTQDRETRYEVELTSACIESVGFFMNNFEGKGSDSATKLFTASMLLRPAMGEINKLDEQLEEAKK